MKKLKEQVVGFLLVLVFSFSSTVLTFAYDDIKISNEKIYDNKLSIKQVTIEELEAAKSQISNNMSSRINLFKDIVLFAGEIKTDKNGTDYVFLHLLNVGFPLDAVDRVKGTIQLYCNNLPVGRANVDEKNLVYGMERTFSVYSILGDKTPTHISYSLTVTDGGESTVNQGTHIPLY